MKTRCIIRAAFTATLLALSGVHAAAKDKPAARVPERAELWVPSEQLKRVLEKHPNAVMLSAEQYAALMRDAGKVLKKETGAPPPADNVIGSLRIKGKALPGGGVLMLEGVIKVRALAEGWSVGKLPLPFADLSRLTSNAGVILGAEAVAQTSKSEPDASKRQPHVLMVRGPADHQIGFSAIMAADVSGASGGRRVNFDAATIPALLELELPTGSEIVHAPPHEISGGVFRFHLNAKQATRIEWKEPAAGLSEDRALNLDASGSCQISESDLTASQSLVITAGAADQPLHEITLEVMPAAATVISVEGDDVDAWTQNGGKLDVKWRRAKSTAMLSVVTRQLITLPESGVQTINLPALKRPGARRCATALTLVTAEGVELLEVTGGAEATTRALWWDALTGKAAVRVRKAAPHVVVDADAAVKVERDAVKIARTVNIETDRALNELRLTLPAGEDLISVDQIENALPQKVPGTLEWKQVGQNIELKWPTGLDAARPAKLSVISEKRLPPGAQNPATATDITIENILVPEADKLAGYIALDEDAMWRVTVKEAAGLEDRDARLTPVKGRAAWFSLREHRLVLEIQRRESVLEAEITAFALPRASAIEIEGQIALTISGAPLRLLVLKMTPALAKQARFLSPLVGERQLDEAKGEWRLTLAREITGEHVLRFRLSLPASEQMPLRATLPRFEMPAARRFRGTWVVEANTDTQLSFEARSLQPLDVMRAPAVLGYEPRHRLVSAFGYGSGPHSLAITATRHASSELASLVVRKIDLTSVLSADGNSKHEAAINLRHTGDQFLRLKLPQGAAILGLQIEHGAVKPVRGADGAIMVPLPGDSAGRDNVRAKIVFELPDKAWSGQGRVKISPIQIVGDAPVLYTSWAVFAPEGFGYSHTASGLDSSHFGRARGLISLFQDKRPEDRFEEEASGGTPGQEKTSPEAGAEIARTYERIGKIIFPSLELSGATLENAVRFLNLKSRVHDTGTNILSARGVKVVLQNENIKEANPVTLSLRNVSMADAIRYVCELGGVEYHVESDAVVISPAVERKPLTRVMRLRVPSDFLSRLSLSEYNIKHFNSYPFADSGSRKWIEQSQRLKRYFEDCGIAFPEDGFVSYDETKSELVIASAPPHLDVAERAVSEVLTESERRQMASPQHGQQLSAESYLVGTEKRRQALMARLDSIIIPRISLQGASIQEALAVLRQKSREMDGAESRRDGDGVNIVLADGGQPIPDSVTMDLNGISMSEALRHVTELAGMTYRVDENAVVVVPITDLSSGMYTETYKIPASFMRRQDYSDDPLAMKVNSMTSRTVLEKAGIPFPEGSAANYLPLSNQLVVRNTRPNLDAVSAFVASLRSDADETAAAKTGLIPLELVLPTAGVMMRFQGAQAPEDLELRYVSWERQMAAACGLMALGGLFFWFAGGRAPWLSSLFMVLVLGVAVELFAEEWLPQANAFLFGWLVALLLWVVFKVFAWLGGERKGVVT